MRRRSLLCAIVMAHALACREEASDPVGARPAEPTPVGTGTGATGHTSHTGAAADLNPTLTLDDSDAVIRDSPNVASLDHGVGAAYEAIDIDHDGERELVISSGQTLWVFEAETLSGEITTDDADASLAERGVGSLQFGDLNGDGFTDVASLYGFTANSAHVRLTLGIGEGYPEEPQTVWMRQSLDVRPALMDANADGFVDLLHVDGDLLQVALGPFDGVTEREPDVTIPLVGAHLVWRIDHLLAAPDMRSDGSRDLWIKSSHQSYMLDLPLDLEASSLKPAHVPFTMGFPRLIPALRAGVEGVSVEKANAEGMSTEQAIPQDEVWGDWTPMAEFYDSRAGHPMKATQYTDVNGDGISDAVFLFGFDDTRGLQVILGPLEGWYEPQEPRDEEYVVDTTGLPANATKAVWLGSDPCADLIVSTPGEVHVFMNVHERWPGLSGPGCGEPAATAP